MMNMQKALETFRETVEGCVSNDEYYADEDVENKETFYGKGDKMMADLIATTHGKSAMDFGRWIYDADTTVLK